MFSGSSRFPQRRGRQAHQDSATPQAGALADLTDLVRKAAIRITRELNDPAWGREDVEQELWARLVQGMPKFDPQEGDRTQFAMMLLKRQRATLIRARYAEKRHAPIVSLQQPIDHNGDETTLASTISSAQLPAARGRVQPTDTDLADLRADVKSVKQALRPDFRPLAELLMSSSIAEAARSADVPRTTMNDQVRALRKPFEQAGMEEYLE